MSDTLEPISLDQLKVGSKRKIGKLNGRDLYSLESKGGLFIIAANKAGKPDVLGLASHPALARHIAKTKHSDIEWDASLAKSEAGYSYDVPVEAFEHLLSKYQDLTDATIAALVKRSK